MELALEILKEVQSSKVYKFFCKSRVEEAIVELKELANRKCENCKFGTGYLGTDRKWCEESIKQDGMTTVDKDFYCKRWESK